jgi:predicted enzyme related to lactoylglutathione lyase
MGWAAWDTPATTDRRYVVFTSGSASTGGLMELPQDARTMGAPPSWMGYVGVDDVSAASERIERLGGVVHVPSTDVAGISRFSVFSDPQAARLGVFKWLNPGQQQRVEPGVPGHVGWHELLAADGEAALAFYCKLFGWQSAEAEVGEIGRYQPFSAGGEMIGGIVTKPETLPAPFWLYYFNIDDVDAAARRVIAGGGEILFGPLEVPGGSWIVRCMDPQGAVFALEGMRARKPIGYFESIDPSGARGRQWSW